MITKKFILTYCRISPKAILAALAHVLNFYSDLDDATRHILRNFAPGHISQLAPSHASQAMPITPRTTSPSSHDVQHPREETPDRSQALASPEKKPMNFLLVDDNPVNLKVRLYNHCPETSSHQS